MGVTRNRLRFVVLIFLVFLSFFLSYKLWTAGRTIREEENTTGQMTRTNAASIMHEKSDVFRPTKVAIHDETTPGNILVGHTYPLKKLLSQTFETPNLNQLVRREVRDHEGYIETLQEGNWLEFIYDEERPIGLLEQKFEEITRGTANAFYNRILVDIDNQDFIYFYNTETEILYVVSVLENQGLEIDAFLNQENLNYVESFPVIFERNIVYLPNNSLTISNRSYVVDQLGNSVYINSFFPDTSAVDVRSTRGLTRYIDLTKEVSINDNTKTLNYLRQISDAGEIDAPTRFTRSFDQINRFENWADTFVLSKYNQVDESISFRREIGGYPVFSAYEYDTVSNITIVESGVTQLKLPLRFIRTPITIPDSDDQSATKELLSGVELLEELEIKLTAETYSQVENVMIGYKWLESTENNQVINFTPEWFVSINDTWMTLSEVLRLEGEAAYGF